MSRRAQRPAGPLFQFQPIKEQASKPALPFIAAVAFAALPEYGPNWMITDQEPDRVLPSALAFVRVRESPWPLCKPGYYTMDIVVFPNSTRQRRERILGPFPTLEEAIASQGVGLLVEHARQERWQVMPVAVLRPVWLTREPQLAQHQLPSAPLTTAGVDPESPPTVPGQPTD